MIFSVCPILIQNGVLQFSSSAVSRELRSYEGKRCRIIMDYRDEQLIFAFEDDELSESKVIEDISFSPDSYELPDSVKQYFGLKGYFYGMGEAFAVSSKEMESPKGDTMRMILQEIDI